MTDNVVCPYCGHHTLYKTEDWKDGGVYTCLNPMCDSNYPPKEEPASDL